MTVRISVWLPMFLVCAALVPPVSAQEMRVYTRVFNKAASSPLPDAANPVVARSLSLFHAGKVYDFVQPSRELTIYEPAHNRYVLFSPDRRLLSTIARDELKNYLKVAEREAVKYVDEIRDSRTPDAFDVAETITFQLNPIFEEHYDESTRTLTMSSPMFRYTVDCGPPPSPELVEAYLSYTDWTARLNSVLHPQSFFPGPRLALNEALRRRGLLPTRVRLQAELDSTVHLQAEHNFEWQLTATDRELIHSWERELTATDVRSLPFRQFQEANLRHAAKPE